MVKHVVTALVEASLESVIKVLHVARQAQAKLLGASVSDAGMDGFLLLTLSLDAKPGKAEWLKKKLMNLPVVLESETVEVGKSTMQATGKGGGDG